VWSLVPPDLGCDVGAQMARLEEALLLYETALKVEDYVRFSAERRRYHAAREWGRDGYVEPFVTVAGAAFTEWFRRGGDAPAS
jgi:hypothetical protein